LINHPIVIFDLDGTLVDSASGILCVFESLLFKHNIEPQKPLNQSLIGPPLKSTLSTLTGSADETFLNMLESEFKSDYDNEGFKKTIPFNGIEEMLRQLKCNNVEMHLATNKRLLPTQKILTSLEWKSYFRTLYTSDNGLIAFESKKVMIKSLIEENQLTKSNLYYIGDRKDDALAANYCGINFIKAGWGYDDFDNDTKLGSFFCVSKPNEIFSLL